MLYWTSFRWLFGSVSPFFLCTHTLSRSLPRPHFFFQSTETCLIAFYWNLLSTERRWRWWWRRQQCQWRLSCYKEDKWSVKSIFMPKDGKRSRLITIGTNKTNHMSNKQIEFNALKMLISHSHSLFERKYISWLPTILRYIYYHDI